MEGFRMRHTDRVASEGQGIFLSYRRSDCQSQANGLHDGLVHRLEDARIFMDIDSIPAGVDFEKHIRSEIDKSEVVLVLIGDNWLDTRPGSSVRRIDEPNDFVRLEIESALANSTVVTIPVLVEGTSMPTLDELPESIRRLARINAFELADSRWKSDVDRLAHLLTRMRVQGSAQQAPPPNRPDVGPRTSMPGDPVLASPAPFGNPKASRPPSRPTSKLAAPLCALAPLPSFGLLSFVPLLRSGIIRPSQRKLLFGLGAVLEVLAIVGLTLVGTAPTDSEGAVTGTASTVGVLILLLAVAVAVTCGFVFKNAESSD